MALAMPETVETKWDNLGKRDLPLDLFMWLRDAEVRFPNSQRSLMVQAERISKPFPANVHSQSRDTNLGIEIF